MDSRSWRYEEKTPQSKSFGANSSRPCRQPATTYGLVRADHSRFKTSGGLFLKFLRYSQEEEVKEEECLSGYHRKLRFLRIWTLIGSYCFRLVHSITFLHEGTIFIQNVCASCAKSQSYCSIFDFIKNVSVQSRATRRI